LYVGLAALAYFAWFSLLQQVQRRLMLGYFTVRSLSRANPIYPVFKEQLVQLNYTMQTGVLAIANRKFIPCLKTGYALHGCSFWKNIKGLVAPTKKKI
jgi:hypothetical protein